MPISYNRSREQESVFPVPQRLRWTKTPLTPFPYPDFTPLSGDIDFNTAVNNMIQWGIRHHIPQFLIFAGVSYLIASYLAHPNLAQAQPLDSGHNHQPAVGAGSFSPESILDQQVPPSPLIIADQNKIGITDSSNHQAQLTTPNENANRLAYNPPSSPEKDRGIDRLKQPGVEKALIVDAAKVGFHSAAEAQTMVDRAAAAGITDLYIQVRTGVRIYYHDTNKGMRIFPQENWGSYVNNNYDPLATVLKLAKTKGLKVHAYFVTFGYPQSALSGYNMAGVNWLDPGNAKVRNYMVAQLDFIMRKYAPLGLDGVFLDFFRYPNASSGTGMEIKGYDRNSPEAKRAAIIDVAKRVKASADAISKKVGHPVKVSIAGIAFGNAPSSPNQFSSTSAYRVNYQDWLTMLQNGYIDKAVLMVYNPRDDYRSSWVNLCAQLPEAIRSGIVIVFGAYLDGSATNTVNSMGKAAGAGLGGAGGYSYACQIQGNCTGQNSFLNALGRTIK